MTINVKISLCKITRASKLFQRNYYLPLLKPLSPKDALRRKIITGQNVLGSRVEHYIPTLEPFDERIQRRRRRPKGTPVIKRRVRMSNRLRYVTPFFDDDMENHTKLRSVTAKKGRGKGQFYIYEVFDKGCALVLPFQFEKAIRDKDIIDVIMAQRSEKVVVKLNDGTRITLPLAKFDSNAPMYRGSGWTKEVIEEEHHHGRETYSLTKLFEAKEQGVEEWELEMMRLANKRKKKLKGEDSVDWKEMLSGCLESMDWNKFEEDTKQIIEEKDEVVESEDIPMAVDDMDKTKNVNDKLKNGGEEVLAQLPTMKEVPEVIKVLDKGELCELQDVSGIRVELSSGNNRFVAGQMVKDDECDTFVPGQTVMNEDGTSEYTPGITICVDNEPTLIPGLVMGEEESSPLFLPGDSTITEGGQLQFEATEEDLPPKPSEPRLTSSSSSSSPSRSPSPQPQAPPKPKPKKPEPVVIRRRNIPEPPKPVVKEKVKKRPPVEIKPKEKTPPRVIRESRPRGDDPLKAYEERRRKEEEESKKRMKEHLEERKRNEEKKVDQLRLQIRQKYRNMKFENPPPYKPMEPVTKSKQLEELEQSIIKGTFFEDENTKKIMENVRNSSRLQRKLFSRNFYLPLLKPLTPQDALRTFRITGKWLLGSKIQHYIPTLLNHTKKRSKREKNYGKIKHVYMEEYTYMMPLLDPDNIESHRNLCNLLNGRNGKGAFVYTVDDKNYNLVLDSSIEFAIRDGDIIDVLMSQGNDKILVKLKDFKKVPVEIRQYTGNGTLFKGEGSTTKEDERFHHHGKLTMSIAKIFEDLERKEEQWEKELKRLMQRKKRLPIEGTKEWNTMVKEATANMDWKKYEKQAKRTVQYIEEPIVEYHIGMEVDFEKTKFDAQLLLDEGDEIMSKLPTLSEIPEIINAMSAATSHEHETKVCNDGEKKTISGVKLTLSSGKECFLPGQFVKSEDGEIFVPGQTLENEFGVEYAPGIMISNDKEPMLVRGLIVGDADNKNPMFAPIDCTVTDSGHLSFTVTHEERVKYKPRKVPVRKVIKTINENPEDNYEEYYYDDEEFLEELIKPKRKLRRVIKIRKVVPPGCVYNVAEADTYEEEEYSEYEEIDDDEDEISPFENETANAVNEENAHVIDQVEIGPKEPTLEQIIEEYKNSVDPRVQAYQEQLEEERMWLKAIDEKITELIVNIETKSDEVKERLEELRNLTVVKEIDPISTASMEDALEIASKITDHPKEANVISEILLTMSRRVLTFPDKNSINIENINNVNIINNDINTNGRSQLYEKLKITLKTASVAAYNVYKNRPQDEVSALKAIGTVLILALQDQDKLIVELCETMADPLDRNEICVQCLKELCQKRRKDKVKTLKSVITDNEKEVKDELKLIEKLKDILDKEGALVGPAFKKIAKNNVLLLKKVIELVKPEANFAKTENNATAALEDAVVRAVKEMLDDNLNEFIKNSEQNDMKDFIAEAVSFAQVLSLDALAHDLLKLPIKSKSTITNDKAYVVFLKRIILIRNLAKYDNGQTAALKELKKNPEFGKKNPRIRQLIRESAALVSNASLLKSSKQIPAKLIEDNNSVALEDYLIQKCRITFPVMVSKGGRQIILPDELSSDVLEGRTAYVLVDEDGISNMKALQKFNNGKFVSKEDDYSSSGRSALSSRTIASSNEMFQGHVLPP
ncbi:hypothetical protein RI129_003412 [Pyrocoelia pectoralis]|uniref:Uncharacterized protein n=1 Tax=Pyrocoelia pectoralis TaxID=417401 RepID=A0AAN7VGW7_9COLE